WSGDCASRLLCTANPRPGLPAHEKFALSSGPHGLSNLATGQGLVQVLSPRTSARTNAGTAHRAAKTCELSTCDRAAITGGRRRGNGVSFLRLRRFWPGRGLGMRRMAGWFREGRAGDARGVAAAPHRGVRYGVAGGPSRGDSEPANGDRMTAL